MADITPIAHIETPFAEKFGVPRQSGVADCSGRIVFAPAYRDPAALRGLEEFSHIWLIWQFDRALRQGWSPTVRPPAAGRQRPHGRVRHPLPLPAQRAGTVLRGAGAHPVGHAGGTGAPCAGSRSGQRDADLRHQALSGIYRQPSGGRRRLHGGAGGEKLRVVCPEQLLAAVPPEQRQGLLSVLANDPRPRYQDDPQRIYGMTYGGRNVRFRVEGDVLTVLGVEERL